MQSARGRSSLSDLATSELLTRASFYLVESGQGVRLLVSCGRCNQLALLGWAEMVKTRAEGGQRVFLSSYHISTGSPRTRAWGQSTCSSGYILVRCLITCTSTCDHALSKPSPTFLSHWKNKAGHGKGPCSSGKLRWRQQISVGVCKGVDHGQVSSRFVACIVPLSQP